MSFEVSEGGDIEFKRQLWLTDSLYELWKNFFLWDDRVDRPQAKEWVVGFGIQGWPNGYVVSYDRRNERVKISEMGGENGLDVKFTWFFYGCSVASARDERGGGFLEPPSADLEALIVVSRLLLSI